MPRNTYNYEILEYFPIDEGRYALYMFVDTMNNMSATYQITIQQRAYTRAGLIFLMTLAKINGSGRPLNSALYGRLNSP
ncbi:hypothetical protein PABY_24420 [Pyrodictium abyssi]|uniref:Uncharacterized protein n=1 Tax=Pyrodictium abyssi TaxID=54256 RepID=A0ABM8J0K7_9CREN|nr:hypothetical protein PABY_24420 [Pyrodictium abyssi]